MLGWDKGMNISNVGSNFFSFSEHPPFSLKYTTLQKKVTKDLESHDNSSTLLSYIIVNLHQSGEGEAEAEVDEGDPFYLFYHCILLVRFLCHPFPKA